MDVKKDDDLSTNTPHLQSNVSPNAQQSLSLQSLDQLIVQLSAQTAAQTALTQALNYLIGQNQQLIDLIVAERALQSAREDNPDTGLD